MVNICVIPCVVSDTRVRRYYKDSKKTFYPGGVEVLLIVRKTTNASWFRFKLQLSTELKVDVHGAIPFVTDFRDRLVGVPKRGTNGWNFEIKGRYNEEHAIKVLNSLESDPSVGLKSAAREMIVALNPPYVPRDLSSAYHLCGFTDHTKQREGELWMM